MPGIRIEFDRSDCLVNENRLEVLKDLSLPVSLGSYCYREYELLEKKYTDEQAKQLCQEKLDRVVETLEEKGVQIIQKDVKIVKDSVHYVMEADFVVVEKTGTLVATETVLPSDTEDGTQVTEE